jgi:two-component system sensor histidine kinase YesM
MSVIIGKVYWKKSYQLCEQLVSLNLNLLNNQIMQVQKMQEYIGANESVHNAVNHYNNIGERDYGLEIKYQRELDEIFYLLATGSMVSNAYIISQQGKYIYFYKDSLKVNYNMLQEQWYKSLVDDIHINVSYVSGLHNRNYLVNEDSEECISMVMPIQIGEGYNFFADAYLVCDMDLSAILNHGSDKEDMQFALIDRNNEFYSPQPIPLNDAEKLTILKGMNNKKEVVELLRNSFFSKSIVVSMKSKVFGWRLVGIKELKEIRDLNIALFLIACITVSSAMIAVILLSNKIANSILMPMNRLIARCNQVAEGDYQVIFKEEESEEISFLSKTISAMINNIILLSEQIAKEEKKLSEEKLRVLQHQINPHFLNNVLQMIKALSVANETDKISRISTLLGRTLTYSIYQPYQNVELKVELDYLQNYIELQNIRYENRILYSIDCDKKIEKVLIPKLTIQPLVENAIEHGPEGDCKLIIDISAENDMDVVCIMVNDNGQGITDEKLEDLQERLKNRQVYNQTSSIGILNVNERIKRLYGEEFGVEIIPKNQKGTLVVIRIPKLPEEV